MYNCTKHFFLVGFICGFIRLHCLFAVRLGNIACSKVLLFIRDHCLISRNIHIRGLIPPNVNSLLCRSLQPTIRETVTVLWPLYLILMTNAAISAHCYYNRTLLRCSDVYHFSSYCSPIILRLRDPVTMHRVKSELP